MVSTPRISALACGSLAALTWGLTGTFIKLLPDFTTFEILTTRLIVALIATLPIFLIRRSLLSEFLTLIRQPRGILLASLMVFYYLFAVRAFQLAPVSDVVLVVGLSPIIGLVVKVVARKLLEPLEAAGALTAFIGLILFLTPKLQSNSNQQTTYLIGLSFAFLSACVTLSYAALFQHYSKTKTSLNPIAVACTTFVIGSVFLTPIAVLLSPHLISKLTQSHSLSIAVGLGIVSTVVPTFCYSYAAKQLPPVLTTTLNLLTPIFAALIAFFWLHERLPLISIMGAVLVLIGIMTLSVAKPKTRLK